MYDPDSIDTQLALAMGWEWREYLNRKVYGPSGPPYWCMNPKDDDYLNHHRWENANTWSPTTSWKDVGLVIDWMEGQGKPIHIEENKSSRRIRFGENGGITETYGGNLPRQICLAALKGLEPEMTCEEYHKCTCENDGIPAGEHIAGCIESGTSSRADPQAYTGKPRKCDNCGVEVGNWPGLVKHVKGEAV